jgi:hypothetical protein
MMLLYRLVLKVTSILFLATFCVAETRAMLPEQDQAGLRTSTKQVLFDFENDPDFWAAVIAKEEEYLRAHPKPEVQNPSKRQKISEDDPDFWAAVIAKEEEYLSQKALSSSATDKHNHNSQLASPILASHLQTPEASQIEDLFDGFSYSHLKTTEDHQRHLINAIHRAKRSVLITSYNFSADMQEGSDLFEAVRAACYRGVKLYFYANKIQLGESEINFLSRLHNLLFDTATVHSKLLVVDNMQITCGSLIGLQHLGMASVKMRLLF